MRTIVANSVLVVASVLAAFAAFAAFIWAAADPGLGGGGVRSVADRWWFLPVALFAIAFAGAVGGLRVTRSALALGIAGFSVVGVATMLVLSPYW